MPKISKDILKKGREEGEAAMYRLSLAPVEEVTVIRIEDYLHPVTVHGENCQCTVECGGEV